MKNRIPGVQTLADLIDRLIVEVNRLSFFENHKREEHSKKNPDIKLIAKWDNLSRNSCELRTALKNEINKIMSEIMESKAYKVMQEPRTFSPAPQKISDILIEMCEERVRSLYNGELVKAFEYELNKKSHCNNFFNNLYMTLKKKFKR